MYGSRTSCEFNRLNKIYQKSCLKDSSSVNFTTKSEITGWVNFTCKKWIQLNTNDNRIGVKRCGISFQICKLFAIEDLYVGNKTHWCKQPCILPLEQHSHCSDPWFSFSSNTNLFGVKILYRFAAITFFLSLLFPYSELSYRVTFDIYNRCIARYWCIWPWRSWSHYFLVRIAVKRFMAMLEMEANRGPQGLWLHYRPTQFTLVSCREAIDL